MDEAKAAPVVTFDAAIAAHMENAARQALEAYGQTLRSVGIFFDFYGTLNDANLVKGVWAGPHGEVITPDGIAGSAMCCSRLLEMILGRGEQLIVHLRSELQAILTQIQQAELRLQQLEKEPDGKNSQTAPVSGGNGDQPQGTVSEVVAAAQDPAERPGTV